jgi:hypothetical protein
MALSAAFISKATSCIGPCVVVLGERHHALDCVAKLSPDLPQDNSCGDRGREHRANCTDDGSFNPHIEVSPVPSENLIRRIRSRKENRIMIETDGDLLQTSARIYVGLLSFA